MYSLTFHFCFCGLYTTKPQASLPGTEVFILYSNMKKYIELKLNFVADIQLWWNYIYLSSAYVHVMLLYSSPPLHFRGKYSTFYSTTFLFDSFGSFKRACTPTQVTSFLVIKISAQLEVEQSCDRNYMASPSVMMNQLKRMVTCCNSCTQGTV